MNNTILGISIQPKTKTEILTEIKSCCTRKEFAQISSLNPEIIMTAQKDKKLHHILENSQVKLIDGIGIKWAGNILGIKVGDRVTGVEIMQDMMQIADTMKLKVLIIGGYAHVADKLAEKCSKQYSEAEFMGMQGYINVQYSTQKEEEDVRNIIKEFNPQMIFVAFGAPKQEYWIDDHKNNLTGIVCVCVGGAVDFLSGRVRRAPIFFQQLGLEWLFRLFIQPWRWKRQLNLYKFIFLIFKQKLRFFR